MTFKIIKPTTVNKKILLSDIPKGLLVGNFVNNVTKYLFISDEEVVTCLNLVTGLPEIHDCCNEYVQHITPVAIVSIECKELIK